jgi:hypothetical protein
MNKRRATRPTSASFTKSDFFSKTSAKLSDREAIESELEGSKSKEFDVVISI